MEISSFYDQYIYIVKVKNDEKRPFFLLKTAKSPILADRGCLFYEKREIY